MGIGWGSGAEEVGLGSQVGERVWAHVGVGGSAAVVGGEEGGAGVGRRLAAFGRSRAERAGGLGGNDRGRRSAEAVVAVAVVERDVGG